MNTNQTQIQYLKDALLPILWAFTSCSEYLGHLFATKLLGVLLTIYNLTHL
jgi:hypothetical protein